MRSTCSKRLGRGVLLVVFAAVWAAVLPAEAAPVASQTHAQVVRQARRAEVSAALDLQPVRERLEAMGMSRAEIETRLSRMDDEELRELADRAAELDSGGDATAIITVGLILAFLWVLIRYTDMWNWFD